MSNEIINRVVPEALNFLGYDEKQTKEIENYAVGHGTLENCPSITNESLKSKGFNEHAAQAMAVEAMEGREEPPSKSLRFARVHG